MSTLGLVEPAHKSVLGAGFLLSSLMLTHLNNGTPVVLSMLALRVVWSRLWYGQPCDHEQHNCMHPFIASWRRRSDRIHKPTGGSSPRNSSGWDSCCHGPRKGLGFHADYAPHMWCIMTGCGRCRSTSGLGIEHPMGIRERQPSRAPVRLSVRRSNQATVKTLRIYLARRPQAQRGCEEGLQLREAACL